MKKKIKQALISLTDKTSLKLILRTLKKYKIKIISSGGTSNEIKKMGYYCKEVSKFTNSDEILGGRVKTLHPKIYSGILNKRKNKVHQNEMKKNNFEDIDLVIVNFYPFENILKKSKKHSDIIENIDIGGPAIARAAAKNYDDVAVITNIDQYEDLINEIKKNKGHTSLNFRQKMSEQAFMETSYYDAVISEYFNKKSKNLFPSKKIIFGRLKDNLRYGENPHQQAAIYSKNNNQIVNQLHGKKLSYNNYNDIFYAISISRNFPKNVGTTIVKHANPCGVSINKNKIESFKEALACDPISAFGGVLSCNFKINKKLAEKLNKIFLEVIIGNGFEKDALNILKRKKNIRLIDTTDLKSENLKNILTYFDSFLLQESDNKNLSVKNLKVVSKKKANKDTLKKLLFAFNVCRNVKSNAIVLSQDYKTIGIGSGQPSRIDSCEIAVDKMNKFQKITNNTNIFAASDAFFPFVDGIEKLVQAGVTAIIQPSGSLRDKEIIKFANQTGIVLVFSKTRHFKH